jgi:hypothetical protein
MAFPGCSVKRVPKLARARQIRPWRRVFHEGGLLKRLTADGFGDGLPLFGGLAFSDAPLHRARARFRAINNFKVSDPSAQVVAPSRRKERGKQGGGEHRGSA